MWELLQDVMIVGETLTFILAIKHRPIDPDAELAFVIIINCPVASAITSSMSTIRRFITSGFWLNLLLVKSIFYQEKQKQ
jgi:hypothetical protein